VNVNVLWPPLRKRYADVCSNGWLPLAEPELTKTVQFPPFSMALYARICAELLVDELVPPHPFRSKDNPAKPNTAKPTLAREVILVKVKLMIRPFQQF
jgi:hypothetical protein